MAKKLKRRSKSKRMGSPEQMVAYMGRGGSGQQLLLPPGAMKGIAPHNIRVPNQDQAKPMAKQEAWEQNAPRLPEHQLRRISEITQGVHKKYMGGPSPTKITRENFATIHEKMEEELAARIMKELNIVAGLEWRAWFPKDTVHRMRKRGIQSEGYIDGIRPISGFLESETFDYVEVFSPRVVLFQHEQATKYFDAAEEAIKEAVGRRKGGDAYFTNRAKAVGFRPKVDADEGMPTPDDPRGRGA